MLLARLSVLKLGILMVETLLLWLQELGTMKFWLTALKASAPGVLVRKGAAILLPDDGNPVSVDPQEYDPLSAKFSEMVNQRYLSRSSVGRIQKSSR